MTAAWPGTLPTRSEQDGYDFQTGEGRLFSETDIGPPKVRRRYSAVAHKAALRFLMTPPQLVTLKDFIRITLMDASLPFTFPAQDGSEDPWLVIFEKDGLPRFAPSSAEVWNVSMRVLVLP